MLEADKGPQDVDAEAVQTLVDAGYLEKAARLALRESRDDLDEAMALLMVRGGGVAVASCWQQGNMRLHVRV
jgi:hypothetical protein